MAPASAEYLIPLMNRMSVSAARVTVPSGARVYQPIVPLSDGSLMEIPSIAERDGRGLVEDIFVPRRGSVSTTVNPVEPVTTPRRLTPVRPGSGILPALVAAQILIELAARDFAKFQETQGQLKAQQDCEIVADFVACAQLAAQKMKTRVGQKTIEKVASPPRVRIHGYSRRKA